MTYSFIIPVKEINNYIKKSVSKILKIQRDDFEIIIFPDQASSDTWPKTRQIASGPGGPAMKRNLAIKDANGEILIFIDDDAYPKNNLLEILDNNFKNSDIAAVGGPAITPPNDNFWQKVSGAVFLSKFGGGFPDRYAPIGKKRYIDDWPSVNLSIRKENFQQINGFNSKYWPGEDTKLCLDLIEKTHSKIIYDPELIVYHHRRKGLLNHLIQIGNYGLHRGYFAKKIPATSFKYSYFLPSFLLLYIVFGAIFSLFSPFIFKIYLIGLTIYFLLYLKIFFDIYKYEKNLLVILNSFYYVFLTHLYYGLRFIQGFIFTTNLKSKYR